MNRTIENPYRVNKKLYICIISISLLTLLIGISFENTAVLEWISEVVKNLSRERIAFTIPKWGSDILKNLSYGCIASTVVAWIIDYSNVKDENRKANSIYDAVYWDLKVHIAAYIETWARLCAVAYKDKDFHEKANTWYGWYQTARDEFLSCNLESQEELICFFKDQLQYSIKEINESINRIRAQYCMLRINNVINDNLERIIEDYRFEFHVIHLDCFLKDGFDEFWKWMDAINKDLVKYINNWEDIRFYNYLSFKPLKFYDDEKEVYKAVLKAREKETPTWGND